MKNVTITIDDDTYRAGRVRAAELGTSLSALVKNYLQGLAGEPESSGVREMPMAFHHEPTGHLAVPNPDGAPYFVDGKWVFTKDGKPRRPGAMRGLGGWSEEFDSWPDGFIDAMYGDDTPASNSWWVNANDVLKPRKDG